MNLRSKLILCKRIDQLKPLKSLIIVNALFDNETIVGNFIRRCFDLGSPELALSTFKRIKMCKPCLQNSFIKELTDFRLYEDVLSVYQNCRRAGCPSDDYTFPRVLKACSALCEAELGKEIHCVVLRTGYDKNIVIQTALVDLYAKIGCINIARTVFDEISKPDLVSHNALISGYSWSGLDNEALKVFQQIWVKALKPNVSTLAAVIPVCTRAGCPGLGKPLHGYAVKSGISLDELLVPALISMYANYGDISSARRMFDISPTKNTVIWNSMIYGCTQNLKPQEALGMFMQMLHAGLGPDAVTFVSVVACCENLYGIGHGESLHACVIKYGLDAVVSVATALISMYAKTGLLLSARLVFEQLPGKNLVAWNSMISGYVHNGTWNTALLAVYDMQNIGGGGFRPDAISIMSVLSACSEVGALLLGKSAHAFSIRNGLDSNLSLSNLLVSFYSKCRQLSISLKLFERLGTRTTISWNALISGCVRGGETEAAASLLVQMQHEEVDVDLVSLISVLPIFNSDEDLGMGMGIHGFAVKSGFTSDNSLGNALIRMYSSCSDLGAAVSLFRTMPERNVVSWNSLVTGYRCRSLPDQVTASVRQMIEEGEKPDYITLLNISLVCSTLGQGKSIHGYGVRREVLSETRLLTSIISMYSRFQDLRSCFSLFKMHDERRDSMISIPLWNTVMSVLVRAKDPKGVVILFRELLETGSRPDDISILSLISAGVQLNEVDLTNSVLAYAMKAGFIQDTAISNALIDLYAKCGIITVAREIFEGLKRKDSVSWSTVINGYGLQGDGEGAVALLFDMECSGLIPDAATYLSTLSACSHAGLVEESRRVWESMVRQGKQAAAPRAEHYACVVDLLGRRGNLIEAYEVVKGLLLLSSGNCTGGMVESLLGACKVHGHVELGEEIGRMVLERDPVMNTRVCVTMHNIYAGAGRWVEAGRVRNYMEEKRLKKGVGFSRI